MTTTAVLDRVLQGTAACHTPEDLRVLLGRGRTLRVKLGVDPSAPDLHLGHAVVLSYLRRLQDLGHLAILIIGDATAMVGDPTGKNVTRPQLTREEVQANARTYLDQAGLVLDMQRVEIVHNSSWFDRMGFMDAVRLGAFMTVARMLERDTFEVRYKAGRPIGIHEFLYPLMQAQDSLEVEADIEIGGTDQTFNLLVGRDVMRDAGRAPQVCITLPILPGLDGVQKMSKSLGNAIGLTESPREMYGKTMSVPDTLMRPYYELLTGLSEATLRARLDGAPREAKAALAHALVARFHGEDAARGAAEEFDRVFRDKGLPDEIEQTRLPDDLVEVQGCWIVRALQHAGLASSASEARRLIKAGGVRVDEDKVTDDQYRLLRGGCYLLQVGKRRFHRIEVPS